MQIPILNGNFTDGVGDFRTSYPVNIIPVPKQQGISNGYLRPAYGITQIGTGPGVDRGGINWNGVCYRVMGTTLVSVAQNGTTTTIGDVGGTGQVTFDYSFDNLAIASGGNLYLYDGAVLAEVTDADIGTVLDVAWVDGYFMTTDSEFLVVTELNNPFAVNPLKYGSSEADPDPVKAILKLRNEPYALNRYTIEVFDNVGGDLFPFQRIEGAQIQKGTVGTHAACVFADTIAFVGSGRNESPAVYMAANGQAVKISTREIDTILAQSTESQLADVVCEAMADKSHQHLHIHLRDRTLVYDLAASKLMEESVWFVLSTSTGAPAQYRARNFVWCYDRWLCGDPAAARHGYLTDAISSHWGEVVGWEFGTLIQYNAGKGAIFHELELVCLPGRVAHGDDPQISTSYSLDGVTWSQDKSIRVGMQGDRNRRITWMQCGTMRNWRIQRFRGDSQAFLTVARLEARLEPLTV